MCFTKWTVHFTVSESITRLLNWALLKDFLKHPSMRAGCHFPLQAVKNKKNETFKSLHYKNGTFIATGHEHEPHWITTRWEPTGSQRPVVGLVRGRTEPSAQTNQHEPCSPTCPLIWNMQKKKQTKKSECNNNSIDNNTNTHKDNTNHIALKK